MGVARDNQGFCGTDPAGATVRQGKAGPATGLLGGVGCAGLRPMLFELRDARVEAEGVKVHHSSITNLPSRLGFS